ncbi:MAG TPA: hypothetical protein PLQ40_12270, partial [Ferruginibacter sp.]|nr:hypothetical protein [Ferruginibacter sp.]
HAILSVFPLGTNQRAIVRHSSKGLRSRVRVVCQIDRARKQHEMRYFHQNIEPKALGLQNKVDHQSHHHA